MLIFLLFAYFPWICWTAQPGDENVTLTFVGFRHGFRNPAMFLKKDTSRAQNGWGWEGESQLTNIGKLQGYSLGQFLRKAYGRQIRKEYFPSDIRAISSSAERSQMTLQCVLAGLYPPSTARSTFKQGLNWQPVAYQINDQVLRTYNLKCPAYKTAYQPISDDVIPESVEWLRSKADVARYLAENSGFNKSLSDLADAADNVQSMIKNHVPLPRWIEQPTIPEYTKESLVKEILKFGEVHQIQCAERPDCAKSMAGLWLNEILSSIRKAIASEKQWPFVINLYASHTEIVLSLLNLIQATVKETPPSAGFILEFKKEPRSAIRLFKHEPGPSNDPREAHVLDLPFQRAGDAAQGWYDFEYFAQKVKNNAFDDWFQFCGSPPACHKNACAP